MEDTLAVEHIFKRMTGSKKHTGAAEVGFPWRRYEPSHLHDMF